MKIIIFLLLLTLTINTTATDVVLHKGLIDTTNLDYSTLIPIFTKKRKYWPDGEKIIVFIKPINSIEHSVFISDWLGLSSYRYKKMLKKQIYTGKTSNVKEVSSDEEMIASVLNTPNSIGYLTNGDLVYSYDKFGELKLMVIYYD